MESNKLIASINFKKIPGSLKSRADVTMPIWFRKDNEGKIHINLALFGGINTIAKNEQDIDFAIKEALEGFFHIADKFGKGIKEELSLLGWSSKKNSIRFKLSDRDVRPIHGSYKISPEQPAFTEMMKTGTSKNVSVEI